MEKLKKLNSHIPLLRTVKTAASLYLARNRVPLTVVWILTNRCNLRCEYCRIPLREYDDLPLERVLSGLDEMAAAGTIRVGLVGGEPLVRRDIHQIVSHARSLGMAVQLYSNGNYVPKNMDTIKLLDGLFVSLDGPRDIHDSQRGEGSFDAAIRGIDLAREHVPVFFLSVMTKKNKSYVRDLADLALEKDCLISYQIVTDFPELAADVAALSLSQEEQEGIYREILELKKTNSNIVTSKTFIRKFMDRDLDNPKPYYQLGVLKCWHGTAVAHVDADGAVNTCSYLIGKEQGLNLRDHSFQEAWEHLGASNACEGCNLTCGVEYNTTLSLYPEAVSNALRLSWKSFVGR